jgi:two-component system, NtrC family, response regulator AtoC
MSIGEGIKQSDKKRKVLVVDDEKTVRDSLRLLLKTSFEVIVAENGLEALDLIEHEEPDLVLLDVMMPKLDGVATLQAMRDRNWQIPVVMLTANNTVKTAVEAMKLGAVDYLNKPFDVESLTTLIVNTLDAGNECSKAAEPKRPVIEAPDGDFGKLVGQSEVMQAVFQKISQVAERDTTVLITGESGTGKELVAKRIHELSRRSDKPFVPINCAAIPETLIESELFGHEKGAFTHAVDRRLGYFELADGGTIFLDEIGELSLTVQVKMLRFLQEHEFYRVGDSRPIRVNVRVVVATNKNLEDLIREKKFRQDLFYRINVINIPLPPLRDRFEDIMALMTYFLTKFRPMYSDKSLVFAPEAQNLLVEYDWPGNVRELENLVESLMALSPTETVGPEDLPVKFRKRCDRSRSTAEVFDGSMNFQEAEQVFEKEMILKALRKTNFVQTRAAELLGISRRILKYKMDKLGISEQLDPASEEIQ